VSEDGAPGPGAPRIAPACAGDLPDVVAIARASLPDAWSPEAFAGEIGRPNGLFLVARAATAALLGYLVARTWVDEVHVLSLAVAPGARRAGVGTRLLAAALEQARGRGAELAHLEVRTSNAGARAFYERSGFAEVGRRRGHYDDGEDALLLTRRLAGASRREGAGGAA